MGTILLNNRHLSPFDILVKNFFQSEEQFQTPNNKIINHPVDIYEDEDGIYFDIACTGLSKKQIDKRLHIIEDITKEIKKTKDFNNFLVKNNLENSIIISDPNKLRLSECAKYVDAKFVEPSDKEVNPDGFDLVFDTVGLEISRQQAINVIKPGGDNKNPMIALPTVPITAMTFAIIAGSASIPTFIATKIPPTIPTPARTFIPIFFNFSLSPSINA